MANRLSIDWPRDYFEALKRVAALPEYAGRLAIYPVANAGERFKAGNFRDSYGTSVLQDTDYRSLDDRSVEGSTVGYEPGVKVGLDVLVPAGNIGCEMIYDRSVALATVRERAIRLQGGYSAEKDESMPTQQPEPVPAALNETS